MSQTFSNASIDPLVSVASDPEKANQDSAPVTVLVARKIKDEHHQEFKAYQPSTPDDEHKVVLCFENAQSLAKWQESPEREARLAHIEPLEKNAFHAQIHSGNQNGVRDVDGHLPNRHPH